MQELTTALPGLTHGEGALWTRPGADRPLRGVAPRRPRLHGNPLNYEEYLRFLSAVAGVRFLRRHALRRAPRSSPTPARPDGYAQLSTAVVTVRSVSAAWSIASAIRWSCAPSASG